MSVIATFLCLARSLGSFADYEGVPVSSGPLALVSAWVAVVAVLLAVIYLKPKRPG